MLLTELRRFNDDIGISDQNRAEIAEGLSRLLADTYTLYLKTHYNELALAVDLVAERIRSLGHIAPGTYAAYARLSSIQETEGVPKAQDMIRELVAGHEAVCRTARSVFPLAEKASDESTADLLTQRLQVHEKTAWMLRSLLEN